MGNKIVEKTIKNKVNNVKNMNVDVYTFTNEFYKNLMLGICIRFDQIIEPSIRPRVGFKKNIYDPLKKYKNIIREKIIKQLKDAKIPIGDNYYIETELIVTKKPLKSFTKKQKFYALQNILKWNTKPDVDNMLKTIYDTVEGIIFKNDSQITGESTMKKYGFEDSTEINFYIYKQPEINGRLNKEDIKDEKILNYLEREDS